MKKLKSKTHVGATPEEIDKLCDEWNEAYIVHFTTPVPRFDGQFERLQLYEDAPTPKPPVNSTVGYTAKNYVVKEKKWLYCPNCAKQGIQTSIMYSHFNTCRVCGYEVREQDKLNAQK